MATTAPTLENLILNLSHEITVRASLDATFNALLEQMGPANETPDGKPLPMILEAWPGGRWFRDLGQGNGHFWGHVQAIKRPTLLEITGPLFMSFPVVSNLQYRLTEVERRDADRLSGTRRWGSCQDDYRENLSRGWTPLSNACASRPRAGGRRTEESARRRKRLARRRCTMSMIEGLLQELEQEAQTTRRVLERVPTTGWPGSRTRSRCRSGSWRCTSPPCPAVSPRWRASRRSRCPQFTQPTVTSAARVAAGTRQERRSRPRRCCGGMDDAAMAADVASRRRRQGTDGSSSRCRFTVHHAEPLVSPSRPAVRLSPSARGPGAVDLRPECRRESVPADSADSRAGVSPARSPTGYTLGMFASIPSGRRIVRRPIAPSRQRAARV